VFSPKYGWYELPEEKVEESTMHDLSWDYFGQYYSSYFPRKEKYVCPGKNFFRFSVKNKKVEWEFDIGWP
jgi:hypothetical protein